MATDPDSATLSGPKAALSFKDVSLRFPNGSEGLRGASLDVAEGEFVSILGPSGCGKSTLLKVASGLIDYNSGQLFVDRSRLAFTFQDATLLPWRTVQGNVELLLELQGRPVAERRRIAGEKLRLVGLSGFESHLPSNLSGGMKMRASLARSLTTDPAVFLFDEPFGALDEITRERLNDELLGLFVRQGFTGLFVTHSVSEAVYLSNRVAVMSARPGRIVEVFDIPFAYPRTSEIRYSPAFAELCGKISGALLAATSQGN